MVLINPSNKAKSHFAAIQFWSFIFEFVIKSLKKMSSLENIKINACGAFIQIHSYQDSKSCFKLVSFYVTLFTLLARARFVLPVLKKYQMIFGIAKLVIFHKLLVAHLEKFASFWLQNWRFRYIFWVSCLVTPCSDGDSKMQQKDNIEKAIISSHNSK